MSTAHTYAYDPHDQPDQPDGSSGTDLAVPEQDTAGRRRRRGRTGRPTSLTPQRAERILKLVAEGNYLVIAAEAVGIHRTTVYGWLERGREESARREEGQPPRPSEQRFLDFFDAYTRARAHAETSIVETISRVIRGGVITKETIRELPDGTVEREITRTPPDGKLGLEVLRRIAPDRWGTGPDQLEVTGAGGGPVEVSVGLQALASRVAAHRRRQEEDEDVIDADVLADEAG